MAKKSFLTKITKCAALALVFGVVGGTAFEGSTYLFQKVAGSGTAGTEAAAGTKVEQMSAKTESVKSTDTSNTADTSEISGVVEQTMPSIVAITSLTQEQVRDFFGMPQMYESESAGSGIIVAEDENNLYIATNNHVVEGASTLTVQFCDDETATASLRGTAAGNDLAVLQIARSDIKEETLKEIKVAPLGDSSKLSVGQGAIAIGNALGYGQSVTTGVISALDRDVSLQDERTGQTVTNKLIQTDAAINPGNSGGALLNVQGEVIGINSSKYSDTTVEGMGFAIPMETAKPIIDDLIANGKTTTTGSGYLGIYGVDVTEDVANTYQMPQGVYVSQVVEGSGAQTAGITAGVIITKADGEEISSMAELQQKIKVHQVGEEVTLTIQQQDGGTYNEKEVKVILGSSEEANNAEEQGQEQQPRQEQEEGAQQAPGTDESGLSIFGNPFAN